MVVPLEHPRHLAVEREQVCVEQVVPVVAAVLREGLGDLGLLRDDEVAPHRAVRERNRLEERPVRVHGVPRADREVRVVKSVAAPTRTTPTRRAAVNLSVAATSTASAAGRSARAHTTALSAVTSPDCTPEVNVGRPPRTWPGARSATRAAGTPTAVPAAAASDATVARASTSRRFGTRSSAISPSPPVTVRMAAVPRRRPSQCRFRAAVGPRSGSEKVNCAWRPAPPAAPPAAPRPAQTTSSG